MNENPFMNLMTQMPTIQTLTKARPAASDRRRSRRGRRPASAGTGRSANSPSRENSLTAKTISTTDTAATVNQTARQPTVPVSTGMMAADTNTP